jgi:hypothetical protein
MHLERARPHHLIAMLHGSREWPEPTRHYGRLLAQIGLSLAFAAIPEDGAAPVAIGGIAPLPGRSGEIWFGAGPALGTHLVRVLGATRQVLRGVAPSYPGGLMCLVEPGHEPGERLARLIGCRRSGVMFKGAAEWVWQGASAS